MDGIYKGPEWRTPLLRILALKLPHAKLLHTLAEASSFLTSFPLHIDGSVGHARAMVFAAVLSGDALDVERATVAVEAVIRDKRMG